MQASGLQEEEEDGDDGTHTTAAAEADIGAGLQPANMADMRAFLGLSGFLVDFLPLPGPRPLAGCAPWLLTRRRTAWRLCCPVGSPAGVGCSSVGHPAAQMPLQWWRSLRTLPPWPAWNGCLRLLPGESLDRAGCVTWPSQQLQALCTLLLAGAISSTANSHAYDHSPCHLSISRGSVAT